MRKETIKYLRSTIIENLKEYEGEPVLLDLDPEILNEIIFDYRKYLDGTISKVFAVEISDYVRKIDFSNISFDGVSVWGWDFSKYKNVKINPQTIFEKNLSYCHLEGVTFTGPFTAVNINHTDFTGSTGAVINPQTIENKNLSSCTFCDAYFIGDFGDCRISDSNFTGSTGAVINPQTVYDKNLSYCVLKDVIVIDDFDFTITYKTIFDGAIFIDKEEDKEEKQKQYCIGKIKKSFGK